MVKDISTMWQNMIEMLEDIPTLHIEVNKIAGCFNNVEKLENKVEKRSQEKTWLKNKWIVANSSRKDEELNTF